jgi:3-hydroxy-9,10-secoandrosta-1,3,5(10)-triene-9,17-dione monooxygenase
LLNRPSLDVSSLDGKSMSIALSKTSQSLPLPTELVDRSRRMIPELTARRQQTERDRRVSDDVIGKMADAGFFRVLQPVRWGGYEMNPSIFYEIEIALAQGDMSVGWVYGVLGVHPWLMGLMDDRAAHDVWGEDEDVRLCSSLMPVGRATAAEDGFRLSGHWRFSSGCHHAQWAVLGGIVHSQSQGPPDARLFLVPRSDYLIRDAWYVGGLRGTGSDDIVLEDTFVPAYRTRRMAENLDCSGAGQALNTSPLYRIPFGQIFFRGVSSASIGALQSMLDAFVQYAQNRSSTLGKAVDDPVAQQVCGEIASAIDEMTAILHRNMETLSAHAAKGDVPQIALRQRYKLQSATVADRCAQLAARLMRVSGAAGIYDAYPFIGLLADINAGRQHIANQVELIGRNLGAAMLGAKSSPDFML